MLPLILLIMLVFFPSSLVMVLPDSGFLRGLIWSASNTRILVMAFQTGTVRSCPAEGQRLHLQKDAEDGTAGRRSRGTAET